MASPVEAFIRRLATRGDTATVTNPYRRLHCRDNLSFYLDGLIARPGRRILLVGEALGYRGGRLTGIPFSSEKLLRQAPHPFLRALRDKLTLEGESSEATASMVWAALAGRRRIPLFWNAFPFHPHRVDCCSSNRTPSAEEIALGQEYLLQLAALYRPEVIAGLGRKGTLAARQAFPDRRVPQLRHPSYGGKSDFLRGMEQLLRPRSPASAGEKSAVDAG